MTAERPIRPDRKDARVPSFRMSPEDLDIRYKQQIVALLSDYRRSKGWTQAKFVEETTIPRSVVGRLDNAGLFVPTQAQLDRLELPEGHPLQEAVDNRLKSLLLMFHASPMAGKVRIVRSSLEGLSRPQSARLVAMKLRLWQSMEEGEESDDVAVQASKAFPKWKEYEKAAQKLVDDREPIVYPGLAPKPDAGRVDLRARDEAYNTELAKVEAGLRGANYLEGEIASRTGRHRIDT